VHIDAPSAFVNIKHGPLPPVLILFQPGADHPARFLADGHQDTTLLMLAQIIPLASMLMLISCWNPVHFPVSE
jgi:hypothetical protein